MSDYYELTLNSNNKDDLEWVNELVAESHTLSLTRIDSEKIVTRCEHGIEYEEVDCFDCYARFN